MRCTAIINSVRSFLFVTEMDTVLQTPASLPQQLTALLTGTGFSALEGLGWIRITGSDRVRWLNGMMTNSIQALAPGHGCYNFALNARGRIQGIANVFAPDHDPEMLLIETDRSELPRLMTHLDHFIIMDDVELADITSERFGLLLAGPKAPSVLEALGMPRPGEPMSIVSTPWNDSELSVIRAHSPLIDRFELWTAPASAERLKAAIERYAMPLEPETLECLRVLEGSPRYGVDIRDSEKAHDLPQETALPDAQSRALHFAKGCYLGQEIVERIRSRGSVLRTFSGFELAGSLPPLGAKLQAEDKPVGELTSIAAVPLEGRTILLALGYVRREALVRKLPLSYPGGTATPVTLPYTVAHNGTI